MARRGEYEYSIWVMPNGIAARNAAKTIIDISKSNGTIPFDPHVTLLGYISGDRQDIIKKTRRLTLKLCRMPISFVGISHSGRYTMPLFIKVKAGSELFRARRLAEKEFGARSTKFAPHMSLMYARLAKSQRLKLLSGIDANYFGDGFNADTIRLYARRWDGKEWKRIASFKIR